MKVLAPTLLLNKVSVAVNLQVLLKPLDLNVEPGSWFGIVGPNGGGKSTLIKAIAGVMPHQGDIYFRWPHKHSGNIGYMPQSIQLDSALPITVTDYLRINCESRPVWFKKKKNTDLEKAIAQLEIETLLDNKLGTLSMGERQRVMLCAALANKPQILLLDEPLAGIDKAGHTKILQVLNDFHQAGGSIVMVEHHWSVIQQYCQQVAWIEGGLKMVDTSTHVLEHLGMEVSPFDRQA